MHGQCRMGQETDSAARYAGCAVDREVELGTEHGLAQALVAQIRNEATGATGRTGAALTKAHARHTSSTR